MTIIDFPYLFNLYFIESNVAATLMSASFVILFFQKLDEIEWTNFDSGDSTFVIVSHDVNQK